MSVNGRALDAPWAQALMHAGQALDNAGLDSILDEPLRQLAAKCPGCADRTDPAFYPLEVSARDDGTLRLWCRHGCTPQRIHEAVPALGVPGATPPIGVGTLAPPTETPINTGDSGVPTGGTPGTLRRCSVKDMLAREPEPVDWLVDGVVARGTLTLLAGREKEGKTMLSMAFAACGVTGGGDLAGIRVEPLRALVVDAENGHRELHRRVRRLGLRAGHANRIEIFEAVGHDLRRHMHELEAIIASFRPDLLLLDSWRSLWAGDENDSGEVAKCLDPLRALVRKYNAGAVLIHHMRKGGGYRGSTAIGASVENVLELSRHDEDPDRRRRRLRNPACRYEQEADDRWMRIEADRERGLLLIDETEPFHPAAAKREGAEERLLDSLNGRPTTWAQWARAAGLDPRHGTARRARDSLAAQQRVAQDDDGHWTVTS